MNRLVINKCIIAFPKNRAAISILVLVVILLGTYQNLQQLSYLLWSINLIDFTQQSNISNASFNDQYSKIYLPKIIHQSWKSYESIPRRMKQWTKGWKKCFPNYEYKFWNDTENRDFLVLHYPWYIETYDSYEAMVMKADAMRYFYLFHYGGIYTDIDNECVRNFEHLLTNYAIVLGAMKGNYGGGNVKEGYVQNSFMFSIARHPFWLEVILEMKKRQIKKQGSAEVRTGPLLLVPVMRDYMKRFPDEIKVYTPEYFNPNTWIGVQKPCDSYHKMNDTAFIGCRNLFKDKAYVIQYHAHQW